MQGHQTRSGRIFAGRSCPARRHAAAVILGLLSAAAAFPSPATFVTALPVARDQLLVRFNFEPTLSTMGSYSLQFPVNVAYGLTSRWALFLTVNQGFESMSSPELSGPRQLSSAGIGDTLAFARFTLFKIDKPRSTLRIAPLAGAFFPSGANTLEGTGGYLPPALQTGSGTVDPYVGVTMGYNNVLWGLALDTTYRKDPVAGQGISPGDEFRADAQAEYRVLPLHMPAEGLPKLLGLSVESNYVHDGGNRLNRTLSPNSGGDLLKQDAVLEWATLHWELGLGAQLPVMQSLPGVGRLKERCGVFLFLEYYLAAPNWRHRRAGF
jgi:hypothetical protein